MILLFIGLANNIEGEQETELLAEYEAFSKRAQQQQQQKTFSSGPRPSVNTLSPNKRRNVGLEEGRKANNVLPLSLG